MTSDNPTDIFVRNTSGRENIATHPSVGIFWGVFASNQWVLINEKTPLDEAEPYADFLTYPSGHYEIWEPLTRLSPSQLKLAQLPTIIHRTEYENFPRGRVVYHRPTQLFTIYADRRLQRPDIIRALCNTFCLDREKYIVRSDEHYR